MKNGWIAACERFVSRRAHALSHHPRKATALLAALLLGGAGTAFGVASLDPDPSTVTVRQVLESVNTLPVQPQLDQLDTQDLRLFRTEVARPSDTVDSLLARLGVEDEAAAAWLRRDAAFRSQVLARYGRTVTVEAGEHQELKKLTVRWVSDDSGNFQRLVVERGADGRFASRIDTAPLVAATRMGSATVRSSLFAAADEANIPDTVVSQMVEIFGSDIDFHRHLRTGDHFEVVYESLEADGEPLRTGRILSVEFVNRGTAHQAIWFQDGNRKGGYYGFDGRSMTRAFLASPVAFSRISSGFAMRLHPILNQWKAHLGVDYAAPIGTPVRDVADGTVEFAGQQNGFGNVVIVRHNASEETVYAHLSRIGVRTGQHIAQGDTLGAVGQTGWATGPHLHYEFRVDNVPRDPLSVDIPNAQALAGADLQRFKGVSSDMQRRLALLDAGSNATRLASR